MRDRPVRDALLRLIGGLGVDVVKRTPLDELQSLLRLLRPIDSGIELIRLGPEGDGGYLLPNDLEGIQHAFSPGVSTESGFEADLASRGLQVYLADYSVDQPAQLSAQFDFDKKFIGCLSDNIFLTMDEWKRAKIPGYDGDLLLQMDIEGAEFEALFSTSSELLSQFRIMVIEFHYLQELLNKPFFVLVSRLFEKLLRTHSVVHIHPNNCCGSIKSRGLEIPRIAEFTFLRNDRLKQRVARNDFPHALDRDNTAKRLLLLHECWYR
jgi:hypothetical protein